MFRFSRYLVNSLKYYWRTNLGVLAGAAIATAVLVGALISGDSVKFSLLELSMKRLGTTEYALESDHHLFRATLAEEIAELSDSDISSLLHVSGTLQQSSTNRLSHIQVYGIDEQFQKFLKAEDFPDLRESNHVAVSQRVAELMGLDIGDDMILKVEKNLVIPLETPVATKDDRTVSIYIEIGAILSDEQLGRFSLLSNQFVPNNLFIKQEYLAGKIEAQNLANILICKSWSETSLEKLNSALTQTVKLQDLALELRKVPDTQQYEVISSNVFINESVRSSLVESSMQTQEVLSYFVNEITSGSKSVPYSFVTGISSGNELNLNDQEIVLNDWAAGELGAVPGDSVHLKYYIQNPGNKLIEKSRSFLLKAVVPISGFAADRSLMPNFPGLGDAETCGEWNPGIPIDLDKIQTRDEDYWETYRGTPKAFVSLLAAQDMWANKFGRTTGLRMSGNGLTHKELNEKLLELLAPQKLGLKFEPVLQTAIAATQGGLDFGQLFIGLSFFIIVAANLLTGLLFVFNAEQRRSETGQLLALGYLPKQIRKLRLWEGLTLAVAGGLIGVFLGVQYSRFIIFGLGTFWRDAVGFSDFQIHLQPLRLVIGLVVGVAVSFISIFLVVRKQTARGAGKSRLSSLPKLKKWDRFRKYHLVMLVVFIMAASGILLKHQPDQAQAVAKYYSAASLMLITGIYACYVGMREILYLNRLKRFNTVNLVLRNWSRRAGRNLTTISLLAVGVFIVISVGLNHQDPTLNSAKASSGTGGFELFVETTMPILDELTTLPAFAEKYPNVEIVQFRKKVGDDGSCLNLNMVQQPQILGVVTDGLENRFTFSKTISGFGDGSGWDLLNFDWGPGVVPAIADMSVIQWGLGLGLGDTLYYVDDRGVDLKLVVVGGIANSVFQGNMIIAEHNFSRYFPSTDGTQVLLVDTPNLEVDRIALERELTDYGPEIQRCGERLIAFSAVENTYLSIFLMLGGFGLLIGTVGLGVVLLRNILEDRQEIAVLQAMGFKPGSVFKLILSEQILTLIIGLLIGAIAAIISILPVLSHSDPSEMMRLLILVVAGMLVNGIFWSAMAIRFAFKEEIAETLNGE